MSEQNVLNPNAASVYSPDYGYTEGLPQMLSMFQAKSGKVFTRQLMARGRVFNLSWNSKLLVDCNYLRAWEAQYRSDFFSYVDVERNRYFTGRFLAQLQVSPAGNDRWNLSGQFIEIPGLAMFAYPTNWGVDSIFMEERDGFGNDLVKLTGTWTFEVNANAHGGNNYFSNTTNDIAEWLYYGYGFRLWSRKDVSLGIMAVSVDGGAETNIDLYNVSNTAAAVQFTSANLALGFHRVKLRCTGTKNGASSNFYAVADAIEVMQ
jgi:hypothetical protein